jgi:hypothetical protein
VGPLTAEVLASRVVPAIETARRSKP